MIAVIDSFAAGNIVGEGDAGHGHAQRPCEGLEDRFGLVVLVVSAGGDVEVAARGAGERMEEVTQHLGGQFADAFAAEFGLPFEADAAPEVDERHGTAVVHGQDLDGRSGAGRIATGIGFFDHMLAQIAHHGGVALSVEATGDLWVDEHHTVEDVGIVLGEAVDHALGWG